MAPSRLPHRLTQLIDWAVVPGLFFGLFWMLTSGLNYSSRWAWGDHAPLPFEWESSWSSLLYSWDPRSLGHPGASGTPFDTLMALVGVSSGIQGFDGITLVILLPISGIVCYLVLRRRFGIVPSALSGLFYALNPLTIAEFDGGDGGVFAGFLILYALLPLVLSLIFEEELWFRRPVDKYLAVVLVGALVGLVGSDLPTLFWMYLPPFAMLSLVALVNDSSSWRSLGMRLFAFALAAAPFLAFDLGLISPVASSPHGFTRFAASAALFVYSPATVLNLIRLSGSNGNSQWVLGFNSLSWWGALGLLPISLTLLGFLWLWKEPRPEKLRRIALLSLTLAAVFTATVIRYGYLSSLMETSSVLAALDDIVRVQAWIAISIALLLPYGITTLMILASCALKRLPSAPWVFGRVARVLKRRRGPGHAEKSPLIVAQAIIAIGVATCLLISNLPAIDGTLGIVPVNGPSYVMPPEYQTFSQLIAGGQIKATDYRVLWLPYTGNDLSPQYWLAPYEINSPYEAPYFQSDTILVPSLYESICNFTHSADLPAQLSSLSVRYLVFDFSEATQLLQDGQTGTGCSVTLSPVFSSIAASPTFLASLAASLSTFTTVYHSPSLLVLENESTPPVLFASRIPPIASGPQEGVTVVANGSNEIENGDPASIANWSLWPNRSLFQDGTDSSQGTVIVANLSEGGLSVASQFLAIQPNLTYQISYQVRALNATAFLRILWFNTTSRSVGDENAMKIDYIFPGHSPPSGSFGWTSLSKRLTPPPTALEAEAELLVGRPNSGSVSSDSHAEFSRIRFFSQRMVPNPGLVISSVDSRCASNITSANPTGYSAVVNGCGASFFVILNTQFDSGWQLSVAGSSAKVVSHYVGNLYANTWQIDSNSILVRLSVLYAPQEEHALGVIIVLGYVAILPVLSAVLIVRRTLRGRRKVNTTVGPGVVG